VTGRSTTSLVCAALALAALALASPSASAVSRLPGLLTQTSARRPFSVRPPVVDYTGDSSGVLGGFDGDPASGRFGHLSWSSWTAGVAVGTGAVWLDTCEPSCAQGAFVAVAVRLRAFAPRNGHFTRLTLRYDQDGEAFVDERGVRRLELGGSYVYYIVHAGSRR
jgi:hypothetical protein